MEWQPIATAPKDGRAVILGGRGWAECGYYGARGWYEEGDRARFTAKPIKPSHWMPLPEPPTEGK